jgi:hypothetical protein
MAEISGGAKARLKNLCTIFSIPLSSTSDNEAAGLAILSHLYAMPAIKEKPKRREYGNQILQNAGKYFGSSSVFVGTVGAQVIMMQEFPVYYARLGKSSSALAQEYRDLENTVYWLKWAGFGSATTGIGGAATKKLIESGSIKDGAKEALKKAVGKGGVVDAATARAGARFPKGARAAGVAGAVAIALGTLAYYNCIEEMEKVKTVMLDRYQRGEASDEDFKTVFGKDISPTDVKKYWEM